MERKGIIIIKLGSSRVSPPIRLPLPSPVEEASSPIVGVAVPEPPPRGLVGGESRSVEADGEADESVSGRGGGAAKTVLGAEPFSAIRLFLASSIKDCSSRGSPWT